MKTFISKQLIVVLLLLVINSTYLCSQNIFWQKCLGGSGPDKGFTLVYTADGGCVIAGSNLSFDGDVTGNHGGDDFWVVKLSALGVMEWQKSLGGSSYEAALDIKTTADGGYILIGYTQSNNSGDVTFNAGSQDIWVVKLDATGIIEWRKCYGGTSAELGTSILQTPDGGYIFAGSISSNVFMGNPTGPNVLGDVWVIKVSGNGTFEWQICPGGGAYDKATQILQASDGGYIVCGHTASNDGDVSGNQGGEDVWMVKISDTGALEWQKCLGGTGNDRANSMTATPDGGYLIAGYTASNDGDVAGNHGLNDVWLVKVSSTGSVEWQKCLGGTANDEARGIRITQEGGYIVCGYTASNDGDVSGNHGNNDVWLVKVSQSGVFEWQKCFGGSGNDEGNAIKNNINHGFYFTGFTFSNDGDVSGYHGNSQADLWVVNLSNPSNYITGNVWFDTNQNGCNANDLLVGFQNFGYYGGITNDNFFTNQSGSYGIYLDSGSYSIVPLLQNPGFFSVSPDTFPLVCTSLDTIVQDFCITSAGGTYQDMEVSIIPLTQAVPGFDADYQVVIHNKANLPASGWVSVYFNDDISDFSGASNPPDTLNTGKLVWNYSGLGPMQTLAFPFTMSINPPTHPTYPVNAGDYLEYGVWVFPIVSDFTPNDNHAGLKQLVVASFDPNDKTCTEGDVIFPDQVGDYLHYIVRFENTGTANAQKVVISDMIDTTTLDITSFQPIEASHSVEVKIENGNVLKFIFDDIQLPFTQPESQGFVAFKIRTQPGLSIGAEIKNTAEIYFDYNFPIITNQAVTTVTEPVSIVSPSFPQTRIYPNPVTDFLYIQSANSFSVTLFDLNGNAIPVEKQGNRLNLRNLPSGFYFLRLTSGNIWEYRKVYKN